MDFLTPIRYKRTKYKKNQHRKKEKIASFDVETQGGDKNEFYSCGIRDEEGFKYYTNKEEAIRHIQRLARDYKYLYATNLNFDFESLFIDTIHYFKVQRIYSGSRLIGAVLKTKSGEIWMSDTLNFLMASLEQLGKAVNLPKLQAPEFLGHKPKNKEQEEELCIYNERDCEVTYQFMKLIQDEVRRLGGELRLTGGSTAMYLFQKKYLKTTIFKEAKTLDNPKILDFIRESMYGGRTEVFIRGRIDSNSQEWRAFTGGDKLYYYDINSMYPSVMLEGYPMPNSVKYWKKGYRKAIDYFEGVSRVRVRTTKNLHIPFLPFRSKEGRLLFPLGEFEGVYTHEELREAMKYGYEILETLETVYYKRIWYPFREYVSDLYARRLHYKAEGNPAEQAVKILLNSLYGKFNQRHVSNVVFYGKDEIIPHDRYILKEGEVEPQAKLHYTSELKYVVEREECDSAHVFPILSAYVTAKSRKLLYKYLRVGKPVYCDTDSIVSYQKLPTSKELGKMKLEDELKRACFIRPKLYLYETISGKRVFKAKGVPRVDHEKFELILKGETVFYKKILRTKEAYKRGLRPNNAVRVFKTLDLQDVKRSWGDEFNPFVFEISKPLNISPSLSESKKAL